MQPSLYTHQPGLRTRRSHTPRYNISRFPQDDRHELVVISTGYTMAEVRERVAKRVISPTLRKELTE